MQNKLTILWNPAYNLNKNKDITQNICTYNLFKKYFIKLVKDNKIILIIKISDKYKYSLDEFINLIKYYDNMIIDKTNNNIFSFDKADILISDTSNLINDFIITEKPIIYTKINNNNTYFNKEFENFLYIINSISVMTSTIDLFINNNFNHFKKGIFLNINPLNKNNTSQNNIINYNYIKDIEDITNIISDITIEKDKIIIKNVNNYDFTKKININIFIAIYTYNKSPNRYSITENIFKHYKNIQEYFKNYAEFTFTIVGSELDISKSLTLKYFKAEEYYEFDQNNKKYKNIFEMLDNKINYGMNISYKNTDADILLWTGSNDYICFNFFKQMIEYYNPLTNQIYGIDNYFNGKNSIYYCEYNDNKILDNKTSWHNGYFNYSNRQQYKYVGGIFGINRNTINTYPDILEKWTCDEGYDEKMILDKPNIDKFNSKYLLFINIKMNDKTEINSYDSLIKMHKNDLIDEKYFNDIFLNIFYNELKYFNILCNIDNDVEDDVENDVNNDVENDVNNDVENRGLC